MNDKIIGLACVADIYSISRTKKLKSEDMIKNIDTILKSIQDEIDYESERCECCGIHPDEVDY